MCNSQKHPFVQVHCHSSASMLDGVSDVKQLAKRAKEFGHPALALTDHGNPANLLSFAKECKSQGIKPILGLEFYICNNLQSRIPHKDRSTDDRDYHQSTYIKNTEGYKNFNKLTYRSFTDGYYYKPRIDFDSLFELKNGLMITSSCMASKTSQLITSNRHKDAEDIFRKLLLEFGEDFYGEIQFNEVQGQKEINDFIIHLCNKYDVPILIGGDVHYLNQKDNELQDAVIRSKRSNTSKEGDGSEKDWVISARHLYFHDTSDYYEFNKKFEFNYDTSLLEKAFENSIKFSEKCNFEFETGKYHLPKIDTGTYTSKEYLEKFTWEGLIKNIEIDRKYGHIYTDEEIETLEKQVEYELSILDMMGLNDYMLMMNKIITWCKQNDIYVGPGRGSAAGSVVAWALNVTSVPPLKHKLIFERFINPDRKQMCDIDTDFEMGGRDRILEYLIEEFGQESVCNVATFGLYGPKSALQDMSRGLNKDTGHDTILMRKISKLEKLDDTDNLPNFFDKVRQNTTDREVIEWIDNNQDTIDFAQRLQGQMRQLGVHAGGILITPGPVYDYIPVTRGSGNLISAFRESDGSAKDLSELGLLKLDVLGLRTLNLLKECVNNLKKDKGLNLAEEIYHLKLDDKKILNYFATGNNYGIFQMDRSKMFTSKIKVDSFEDIVAINAINRPGPLEKFLDKYGYWKQIDKGEIEVDEEELKKINKERYPYPFMEKVLKETYGCLLYQEQFMFLVQEAGGFNLGEADNFRRGIAWLPDHPKYHTVEKYYQQLEKGMVEKGYSKEDTDVFVKYCRDFAGYSFNRAHSCLSENCFVETREGAKKSIKNIIEGEIIKCFNEQTSEIEFKKVKRFFNQGIKKVYKITTESSKTLELTDDHLLLTEYGYFSLKECLEKDSKILTFFNFSKCFEFERIIKTEYLGEQPVYDLEIDSKFHNFIANDIVVHNCVYGYIAYQTLYFKVYYPAYFYAAMINLENDTEVFKQIIIDATKNGIKILPHSITKSKYKTIVESDDSIRLGFGMIKGMGGAVEEELLELKLHECTSLNEVLQKPFKKINSTMLQNLIELGCFEEFGVEPGKLEVLKELYQDEKIAFWFTRQKQKLRLEVIPSTLKNNFNPEKCLQIAMKVRNEDNPHIALINQLIPDIKIRKTSEENLKKRVMKKQQELLGFSLITDNPLAEYESSFNLKGILPLKEYDNNPDGEFYFILNKKEIKLTKTGKEYLVLHLNDGMGDYKVKCWKVLPLEEEKIYYAKFNKDQYGFTLNSHAVYSL